MLKSLTPTQASFKLRLAPHSRSYWFESSTALDGFLDFLDTLDARRDDYDSYVHATPENIRRITDYIQSNPNPFMRFALEQNGLISNDDLEPTAFIEDIKISNGHVSEICFDVAFPKAINSPELDERESLEFKEMMAKVNDAIGKVNLESGDTNTKIANRPRRGVLQNFRSTGGKLIAVYELKVRVTTPKPAALLSVLGSTFHRRNLRAAKLSNDQLEFTICYSVTNEG
jgi:hypothetical protein